jgi:hypothetical protein
MHTRDLNGTRWNEMRYEERIIASGVRFGGVEFVRQNVRVQHHTNIYNTRPLTQ